MKSLPKRAFSLSVRFAAAVVFAGLLSGCVSVVPPEVVDLAPPPMSYAKIAPMGEMVAGIGQPAALAKEPLP